MASNDQWPPVSSAASAKASAKTNGNKRHVVKDEQQEILNKLNEMFGSTLEPGVILSVVMNCNWNLQASIEGLITLGETVENPPMSDDSAFTVEKIRPFESREGTKKSDEKKVVVEDSGSVQSPWEEATRAKTWGKPRKSGTKNRMDFFCGNIAKLKSSGEKFGESGISPGKMKEKNESCDVPEADVATFGSAATGHASLPTAVPRREFSDNPAKSTTFSAGRAQKVVNSPVNRGNETKENNSRLSNESDGQDESKNSSDKKQNVARFDKKTNVRKNESESLCGLKVQYRLNGMSSSDDEDEHDDDDDDDDDADVVIEDETSDYTIDLRSAITSSVSQFLSPSTQAPPRGTKPEIDMISTPSPPRSPQRSIHDATFARIKSAIARGNKILVLLRGLPGSGKTTLARSLVAATVGGDVASHVYSSDDFFVTLGRGVFKFEPSKLSEAHTFNRSRVAKAMKSGLTPIIVDNTNIEAWEMRPYAALAVDGGYIVEILEPNTPWARNPKQLAEKNTHNVTKTKLSERASKFEIIPDGRKLLDKFGLKYSPRNDPYLRAEREESEAEPRPSQAPSTRIADLKSDWTNDRHKNNYVLTSRDIESMQKIDETRHDSSNVGETNIPEADRAFKDYLKNLSDSDDESFEIVDDGSNENRASFEQCVRHESTSGSSSSSSAIAKDTLSETTNSQQTLGAIGSERKFNHSTAAINIDESANERTIDNNVLSPCWDFTLVHEGLKLHSSHGHYVSLYGSRASNEAAEKTDPGVSQNENNKLQNNDEELSKVEDIDCIPRSESITKSCSDENAAEDFSKENLAGAIFSENDEEKITDSDCSGKCEPELVPTEGENGDEAVPKMTMFDAILNLLKIPNVATPEESSTDVPPLENQENEEYSDEDTSMNERDEEQPRGSSPDRETTNSMNLDNIVGRSDETKSKNHSTNPFRTGAETLTDNINSVSWKESPFPIDGTKIPVVSAVENERKIVKADAETMTTLYDFNVAYVGGTMEPGYRELRAVSRSINEGTPIPETIENRVSSVAMFDKSSMTGEIDILAGESDPGDLSKEKDSTNRLNDLIEMFPHYPREYLKTLYEQQCNCNFDWVVDVLLLADVPNLTIENYEKSETDKEKPNPRSHSFSPKKRRNRAKDLHSLSLECVQDGGGEKRCDEEDKLFETFYNEALTDKGCSVPQSFRVSEEGASSWSIAAGTSSSDEESSETIELDFGRDFINQLEKNCGNPDFVLPVEFKPVMRVKKSLVEELYGLWIESMDHQMKVLHARLDERMAKDEAMARAVSREESVGAAKEPVVPNLEEIMNMEMALAKYHNELKEKMTRETPNDMASRLTRQMLYELLPDLDREMLSELLVAHGGNFKETCEIIEANIGRAISKSDSLKKQRSLLERVHEESKNLDTREENSSSSTSPLILVSPEKRTSVLECDRYQGYRDAIARGRELRAEAQTQASLRIENYNKAAEAYRKGLPEVAAYYSQMVKLHTENIEAAHANAAEEFLSAQTFTENGEDTLDLHNLFVREALQAVDIFLDYQLKKLNKSTKRCLVFYIITGYGARSNNRLGRIKPAVTKKLMSKNIRFTEANPGCLKVTLNRRNGASE